MLSPGWSSVDTVNKWMSASRLKLNSDKSEFMWVGTVRTLQKNHGPAVTISTSVLQASDNKVQLLGVGISADLTFDRHVTKIAGQCFYQLRQLRFFKDNDTCIRLEPS